MFEILIWVFFIWITYELVTGYFAVKKIERSVDEAVSMLEEHSRIKIVVFERIKHNEEDVVLCFDKENNFVAQGATQDEAVKLAQQRYPNKNIATYKNEDLQWINQKSDNNSKNG